MKPDSQKLTKADIERVVGHPIHSFTASSGSKHGDNVAGNLLALEVFKQPDSEPLHLVYKAFPTEGGEEQRQYVVQFGIFHTETCMYEKIFPRIEAILKKKEKVQSKTIAAPKYISGFNDDKNDYVCLEDLRPQGFKMQDKFSSLTEAEVTLIMKELGRFHALTNFLIRYDGEVMFEEDKRIHKIKYNALTVENPFMSVLFSKMNLAYLENTVELLEPRDKELADHVRKFLASQDPKSIYALQRFNFNRTDKTIFPCIVHGDLWTNNILLKYDHDGDRQHPVEVKFIDFQLSRRGNIYEDLGYFFWTSTTPEFRMQHLEKMLNIYFTSFQGTMEELDFPMPQGFTRGTLIDGFYQGILTFYLYMPFALGLQMGDLKYMEDPDEQKNNNNGIVEHEKNGDENPSDQEPSSVAPSVPPAMDFDKMVKSDKKMHMMRMTHSPRAVHRLEDLTREIVGMKLL